MKFETLLKLLFVCVIFASPVSFAQEKQVKKTEEALRAEKEQSGQASKGAVDKTSSSMSERERAKESASQQQLRTTDRSMTEVERAKEPSKQNTVGPTPVENPRESVIVGPDGNVSVVNPDRGAIRIESFTLLPDYSGQRVLKARFTSAPVSPTHFRVAHITQENVDAPFKNVGWTPYRGGDVTAVIGCPTGMDDDRNQRVALQLRGPDRASPTAPGVMVQDYSPVAFAELVLPESARARIERIEGARGRGDEVPVSEGRPGIGTEKLVLPGSQTSHGVVSNYFYVANIPRLNDVKIVAPTRSAGCYQEIALGAAGGNLIQLDGLFDYIRDSCEPEFSIRMCGRGQSQRLVANETFEKRQVIHERTENILPLLTSSSKEEPWEIVNGDLSISNNAKPGLPRVVRREVEFIFKTYLSEKYQMIWTVSGSGACTIGPLELVPGMHNNRNTYPAVSFDRVSDMHWAYDRYPDRYLVSENLDTFAGKAPIIVRLACPPTGGNMRVTLDRVIHTWWAPVEKPRTVR